MREFSPHIQGIIQEEFFPCVGRVGGGGGLKLEQYSL